MSWDPQLCNRSAPPRAGGVPHGNRSPASGLAERGRTAAARRGRTRRSDAKRCRTCGGPGQGAFSSPDTRSARRAASASVVEAAGAWGDRPPVALGHSITHAASELRERLTPALT